MGSWENGRWTGTDPLVGDLFSDADDVECQCCSAKDVSLKVYRISQGTSGLEHARQQNDPPFRALCKLCAGTGASVQDEWHKEDAVILQAICFVGNEILKAIKGGRL
jgi:hypothetical protein